MHPITIETIRAALACVPSDLPRDEWARVGMAIKSELGADGFDMFDAWSQGSERYDAAGTKETWRSIKAGGKVSIGTLFHIAKGYGFKWDDSSTTGRPDPAAVKAQADARKARDEAERMATQARHSKAADQAAKLWAKASDNGQAPYLARKGVQAFGVRAEKGGSLLVPMVDEHGVLWNVQRIAAQCPDSGADKRFLPGGRKSGLMHWIAQAHACTLPVDCTNWPAREVVTSLQIAR